MKAVVFFIFAVVFIPTSWSCVTDSKCDQGYLCLKNHCICTTCKKEPISKIKASELECDETNCDYGTGYCDENDECAAIPPPVKSEEPILKINAGQPVCDETNCPLDIGLCSESGICEHHSIKKAAPSPCVLGSNCPNGCGCRHGRCLCRRPFLNTFNPNQGPELNMQPPPFCALVTDCPRGYQCVDNECVLGPTAFVETLEEEEAPHAATHAPHPCETIDDCPPFRPYACEHGICVDKCIPGNAC